jgi:hypothetical protein
LRDVRPPGSIRSAVNGRRCARAIAS